MLHPLGSSSDPGEKILATWRLGVFPLPEAFQGPLRVTRLPDHRGIYLTYEGPIRPNRGACRIVDRGDYRLIEHRPDLWRVHFSGTVLKGFFSLKKNADPDDWDLAKDNN